MKNIVVLFLLSLLLVIPGCQKSKNKTADLSSLNLLRGELILCGGDQFGEVSFSLSCDYETRETFDLAVSLLHSFEYEEAEKAFVQVLDADPDCVMAYWGVAMSISHSIWYQTDLGYLEKGSKLLEIANNLPSEGRERDYLNAITTYYKDWETKDKKTRALLYEEKMKVVYEKYPDDLEAAVFYSLALRAAADPTDKSYVKQKKSGKILEEIFVEQPNHPGIAHYIIHNYDYAELAHKALPTARRYAAIAPASSHAQHMPSHIFTRMGLWDESVESNVNSSTSARCYAESTNMDGHWSNELHAMGYLVYAYLQKGDNKNAEEQYEYMKTMYNVYSSNLTAIAYPFAAIPSRIAIENRNWQMAASVEPHKSELDWKDFPWQNSIFHYTRAIGSIHLGDFETAKKEFEVLKSLSVEIEKEGNSFKIQQVKIHLKQVEGLLMFNNGDMNAGIELALEAAQMEDEIGVHGVTPSKVIPAREFLGDMLLSMNEPERALKAYEDNLVLNPNRFNGLYGAALAAKSSGNEEKARKYFGDLLKLTNNVDSERKEIAEAKNYISNS